MKVLKVEGREKRERLERKLLRKRRVVAIVGSVKDINTEFVKRADVIIVDESLGKPTS